MPRLYVARYDLGLVPSTCPLRQWLVGCLVGVGPDLALISFWTSFFAASLCRPSACSLSACFDSTILF